MINDICLVEDVNSNQYIEVILLCIQIKYLLSHLTNIKYPIKINLQNNINQLLSEQFKYNPYDSSNKEQLFT